MFLEVTSSLSSFMGVKHGMLQTQSQQTCNYLQTGAVCKFLNSLWIHSACQWRNGITKSVQCVPAEKCLKMWYKEAKCDRFNVVNKN
jgi:hypothetical protein